jgi:hypothetical protein
MEWEIIKCEGCGEYVNPHSEPIPIYARVIWHGRMGVCHDCIMHVIRFWLHTAVGLPPWIWEARA